MRNNLSAMFQAVKYKSGRSLTFNGISDWMANLRLFGAETFLIRNSNQVTISIWVKAESASGAEQTILSRWFPTPSLSANEGGWRIFTQTITGVTRSLSINLSTYLLQGLWVRSNSTFPLNTWTHVAMTYDGSGNISGLKMYWDGVLQAVTTLFGTWTDPTIGTSNFSHLMWGTRITNFPIPGGPSTTPPIFAYFFEGKLDETCFWRGTPFTATEVLQLYNGGRPTSPLHVGLPTRRANRYFRMGEGTDGAPFGALSLCVNRVPVGGTGAFPFWNNDGQTPPLRVVEDVA